MVDLNRHSLNVSRLSVLIAIELNIENSKLRDICDSGLYHDIGKTKISNRILNKRNKLSNIEMEVMKLHSKLSADMVKEKGLNESVVEAVLHHHERFDGSGYPDGLKEENIPLYSKIIALADAYDAMTHNRVYSRAKSEEEALKEIIRSSGTQFDPKLVEVFKKVIEREVCEQMKQIRA